MTATPDEIPTDLTLEIDANISPDRFLAAARAFFGYVQDITKSVAPEGEVRWVVRVREGSQLLGVEPANGVPSGGAAVIYYRAEVGLKTLAAGDVEESGLPEDALKHLRTLAELAEGTHGKAVPVPMRVWVRRQPIEVEPKIARVIREELSPDYRDYGTIEGRLEAIQESYGGLQFQIRDATLRQRVRCYFPEELLPHVFENFRRRVEVSGIIHYRKDGTPVSISAERLDPFPDDSELPTASDVRGILAN